MKADTTIGIIDCSDLRGKGHSHTYYIVGDDIGTSVIYMIVCLEFTVNELNGLGIHKDHHTICYVTLKMETLSTSTMAFPVSASKIGRPMYYSYTDAASQILLEDCIITRIKL